MNDLDSLSGKWCVFPRGATGGSQSDDAIKIYRVEEIGLRFGGIPYIRFQAEHNHARVIELLGAWCIKLDSTGYGLLT
jgi:hypothetical protein